MIGKLRDLELRRIVDMAELDDGELEYCQLLRYCSKIDELENRKENENNG